MGVRGIVNSPILRYITWKNMLIYQPNNKTQANIEPSIILSWMYKKSVPMKDGNTLDLVVDFFVKDNPELMTFVFDYSQGLKPSDELLNYLGLNASDDK